MVDQIKFVALTVLMLAVAAPSLGQIKHPLHGKWEWYREETKCTEVYDFRPDGNVFVRSGAEISKATYAISGVPDANGFYELTVTTEESNRLQDCSDFPPDLVGTFKPSTNCIIFHRTEPIHIVCQTRKVELCFGPLRKTE